MELLKDQAEQVLSALGELGQVFVPAALDEVTGFAPYKPGLVYDLELINTAMPPKQVLFPQTQAMYTFTMGAEAAVEEIADRERRILFGLRPCDVQALGCLNKVFPQEGAGDILIAICCCEAGPTCFCGSMGVQAGAAPWADLLLSPTVEGWNIVSQSPQGEQTLAVFADLCREGVGEQLPTVAPSLRGDVAAIREKLPRLFEHPLWDTLHLPCLGCGVCTFVCPGCHCFALAPERRGQRGIANRYWDSCMFAEYSSMAGGHNPRPGLKERLRNRYMHKLSYFPERYGQSLCVGCGRCVAKCPAGLDIGAFIEKIGEMETS